MYYYIKSSVNPISDKKEIASGFDLYTASRAEIESLFSDTTLVIHTGEVEVYENNNRVKLDLECSIFEIIFPKNRISKQTLIRREIQPGKDDGLGNYSQTACYYAKTGWTFKKIPNEGWFAIAYSACPKQFEYQQCSGIDEVIAVNLETKNVVFFLKNLLDETFYPEYRTEYHRFKSIYEL